MTCLCSLQVFQQHWQKTLSRIAGGGEYSHFSWEIFPKFSCSSVKMSALNLAAPLPIGVEGPLVSVHFSVWKNAQTDINSSCDLYFQSSSDNLGTCFINPSLQIIFFGCEKKCAAKKSFSFPSTSFPSHSIFTEMWILQTAIVFQDLSN